MRVTEDGLAGEGGDDLADDTHTWQDHDVHGRVRVEPEHVLEEQRVAAEGWIEEADARDALDCQQQQRDAQDRRGQHQDDAGGVHRPQKQRQAEPGQTRCSQAVNADDEVQTGQDRRKADDEDTDRDRYHAGRGGGGAEGGVEGPAGVDAAVDQRPQRERRAEHVDVPAEQVEPRKRQVARAEHERHDEIPQHAGNRRDQEKPHHHHAVHGEQFVVGLRVHERAVGGSAAPGA